MITELTQHFGEEILNNSCLRPRYPHKYLYNLINKIKPKQIIEIGTNNGISSAFFAQFIFVKKVITIDPLKSSIAQRVWKLFNVLDKIIYVNNFSSESIMKEHQDVDLAFIDGDHNYENVKKDFEMIKNNTQCKYILFHDYFITKPAVKKFIDSLGKEIIEKREDLFFALWKRKDEVKENGK